MKVRFQADADLHHAIVSGVRRREPAVEIVSAYEAGLAALDDDAVLALAARAGRVLVTHDGSTMPAHFARRVEAGGSAGVLIVHQHLPVATVMKSCYSFGSRPMPANGRIG